MAIEAVESLASLERRVDGPPLAKVSTLPLHLLLPPPQPLANNIMLLLV